MKYQILKTELQNNNQPTIRYDKSKKITNYLKSLFILKIYTIIK